MEFISPITWVGGKSKHFNKIKKFFPKNIQFFIEPFCGGASVGLNVIKEKLSKFVLFNDLNSDLINFWNNINNIDIDKIKKLAYPNIKDVDQLKSKLDKGLQLNDAEMFLINNSLTFNGYHWGTYTNLRLEQNFNLNKINRLSKLCDLLNEFYVWNESGYWFHNTDYKNIINGFCHKEEAVWYFDPPYFYNKGKPYKHSKINFKEFKQLLLKIKGKWILSIDNSPEIRELFKEFSINEFEWAYTSSNCHNNKAKIGKELIITNFNIKNIEKKEQKNG